MKLPILPRVGAWLGKATQLTRRGRLADATAAIQRALRDSAESDATPQTVERVRLVVPQLPPGAGRSTARDMPLHAPPGSAADGASDEGASFAVATLTTASGPRTYKLFVPGGQHASPLPLIVMLHGCKQDPDDFAAGTRMNTLAQEHGALVLYPLQPPRSNVSKCWNWFQPGDQRRDHGEPALLAAMTREVIATHAVDPTRVYVAGLSAGGAMAAILGREYPDLFAAVGVHSGLPPGAAHDVASAFSAMARGPSGALPDATGAGAPMIVFHGDRDSTVHPKNGELVLGALPASARREEVGEHGRHYTRSVFTSPEGRVQAEHWLVHGAGHAWSGGSADGSYADPLGPDASREMLRFFLEHARRATA